MNKLQIPYLSIFFHELKSPLSAIANTAKLIELSLDNPDVEKIKRYTALIVSQTFFLKNYISNNIQLGKLQSGKEDLIIEEFDIVEMLHEIVEITKILIENKPIKVKTVFLSNKFLIQSDHVKIKQILLNIASNAVKFTKEGYILFKFKRLNNKVLFKIQDTGIGIPTEDMKKIFNPWCSIESRYERLCESSGLGLYITKQLINLLGGNISIKSEYGKGTTVYISIPYKNKE